MVLRALNKSQNWKLSPLVIASNNGEAARVSLNSLGQHCPSSFLRSSRFKTINTPQAINVSGEDDTTICSPLECIFKCFKICWRTGHVRYFRSAVFRRHNPEVMTHLYYMLSQQRVSYCRSCVSSGQKDYSTDALGKTLSI